MQTGKPGSERRQREKKKMTVQGGSEERAPSPCWLPKVGLYIREGCKSREGDALKQWTGKLNPPQTQLSNTETLSPVSAGFLLWVEASLRDEVALGKEEAVVNRKVSDSNMETLRTPWIQAVLIPLVGNSRLFLFLWAQSEINPQTTGSWTYMGSLHYEKDIPLSTFYNSHYY